MKLMKLRRIIICILILAMLLCLTACQSVNRSLPDYSENAVVYRSAWWCPDPTADEYDTYKDGNFNTVMLANHNFLGRDNFWEQDNSVQLSRIEKENYYIGTPDGFEGETQTDKALALAKERDLYVILSEGGAYFDWIGHPVDVYKDFTIDYSDYKETIVGLFSGDEPAVPAISERADNIENAETAFPDVPYFCNLFPFYADARSQLKCDSYQEYLDTYCKEFLDKLSGPRLLSVDYYPFQGYQFTMWLYNYQLITRKMQEYDADFHAFIQACTASDGSFDPLTEEEVRLQVNVALAYGATAYSYYLYVPAGEPYLAGLVDYDGNPTDMYYHAQKANAETASLEQAYAHYDYITTMAISDEEEDFTIGAFSPLTRDFATQIKESVILNDVTVDNRALVTLLRDKEGNEAFYVVNFFDKDDMEMEEDCTITLQFDGMKKVAVYGTTECLTGSVSTLSDHAYTCTLKPGEGALVVPYTKD